MNFCSHSNWDVVIGIEEVGGPYGVCQYTVIKYTARKWPLPTSYTTGITKW